MDSFRRSMVTWLVGIGTRWLPFADAATPEVSLARLLRLSLFQVSVGMALVLLVGTLNRVMIVELSVPASLVAVMLSLPVVFAPFRALIGFRSDRHRSALGWRRVPFIWRGTMLQFGGLAIMPFALLVLAGEGEAADAPRWIGLTGAAVAFFLIGAGLHTIQTAGLALATDLAPPEAHPKIVGLMYVMLLLGSVVAALAYGALLEEYTPLRLIQVLQGSAVVTIALNLFALWKQEGLDPRRFRAPQRAEPGFLDSLGALLQGAGARRRLLGLGLGTMAFSMQEVVLEPYGGQVLGLSVGATTALTACLAMGGLLGFGAASRILSRGYDPFRMACNGALLGVPGFLVLLVAAPLQSPPIFALGVFVIGCGGGLFGHGTLTATMGLAARDQVGLALGAWGAVQATCAGVAVALGGILRDLGSIAWGDGLLGASSGYVLVYAIEVALLFATLGVMLPLAGQLGARDVPAR